MKTNTKQFLTLIEKINNTTNWTLTLNDLYERMRDAGFSVNDEIIFEYTNKSLKPADFKVIFENNNIDKLYFITAIKNENKNNYNNYNDFIYYCFKVDKYNTIKEYNHFIFTYSARKTNAELRKNASFTILFYQNKKYYETMMQKRDSRAGKYTSDFKNDRFIFALDFYNEYSEPENRQRYKYFKTGFDPKQDRNILVSNIVLKCKYHFAINSTLYNPKLKNILMDKSGYNLTNIRDDLQRRARRFKEKNAVKRFEEGNADVYLTALKKDRQLIENQIITAYKNAVASGDLQNIIYLNNLYDEKIKKRLESIDNFIQKLSKKNYSCGLFNWSASNFEEEIKELLELNKNYFSKIIKSYNEYINFDKLYRYIEDQKNYKEFDDLLKQYNYKWSCPINCYNENKHKIENNKIYFLGCSTVIKNYFSFMEV